MNKKHINFLLVAVIALAATVSEAQTYGGEAAAVRATVTAGANPVVTTSVLDTGSLPAAGGNISLTGAAASVPGIVSVGSSTAQTSGGATAVPPTPLSSQSQASVNSLNVGIDAGGLPDLLITADAISSTTMCTCSASERTCTGSTVVTNLSITDPDGNNTVFNGVIAGTLDVNIFAGGILAGSVRINEQITSPGSITVNGIHVNLDLLGVETDVLVVTAHSDITCAIAPLNDFYSGRATAIRSRNRVSLLDPDVTAIVADTGYLPTTGGAITATTANPTVPLLALTSGTVTSRTFGGAAGAPETDPFSSASDSTVEDLGLSIGLISITADAVSSNTRCTCSLSLPTCTGDSILTNLTITVLGLLDLTVPISVPPNTVVSLPLGLGQVVINEQIVVPPAPSIHPENITVNALRITLNVAGLAQSQTIVASSHSDIDCATMPSAAPATVSGRVTDANGRGISRAVVTIRDGSGFSKSAITNTFGSFTLADIPTGTFYFLSTEARGYRFDVQTLSLEDNVTGLTITPAGNLGAATTSPTNLNTVKTPPPAEISPSRISTRTVY